MLEQLLQFDTDLFLYLNKLGTETWDGFWMFYTTKFNWIPFYAVLLYFIFKQENRKMFVVILLLVVAMVTFTDQVTNLFKHGLMRPRPCHEEALQSLMRLVKPYCGGKYGYFSGHASNSMAVAIFSGLLLRKRFKNVIWMMIVWSIAMGYSRIYIGVHYPLDVLSGLVFGALSGYMFYRLSLFLRMRFRLA
ncbi:phosphoesterase [Mangrovimonas yunxiaonensis]|uniref:Phosphoesterase n=1 Tax=Mangrovimonas yunxiaonensis TaxID=1197477 RepID=A0A084TJ31_9FLAO|nr:phosphatase PAP2 family protein [Mangrovimonas yunxiaonensis]KFB00717.1 phosphoesterase [Mangrovimonas yunxiaonensis]GGH46167.1 phosphatase PAP2 family protein [Mangrovimonas yunxiaonensis]